MTGSHLFTVRIKNIVVAVIATLLLVGCTTGHDSPPAQPEALPRIVVMYGLGGLGDQGYNDLIMTGIQSFKKTHYQDVEIYQYSPDSADEAQMLLSEWLSYPQSEAPSLFVAAASDYERLVADVLAGCSLADNKCLLLFESDNQHNLPVTTFRLSMRGASYLAGVTAAAALAERTDVSGKDVLVLLANSDDNLVYMAQDGFADGFREAGGKARVDTEYLADDWTGYISVSLAYERMEDWSRAYDFIFPVAGGSNHGVYRYTREHPAAPLTAGMDVDQAGLSHNITGSVIKHIDRVVYNYLDKWLAGGEIARHAVYGLESGYVDWVLSPGYSRFSPTVEAHRSDAIAQDAAPQ